MTLPGEDPIDPQFKAVEKTAMYRSTWELAAYVHHHIADLADERRACSPIDRTDAGPASLVAQLRHRLGMGLIRVGHALADYDTVRRLPTPSAHPATWGSRS